MKTSRLRATPPCVIQESKEGIYIVYNFGKARHSRIEAFLSTDKTRLHIVGEKELDGSTDEFLWSYSLPDNADYQGIQVQHTDQIYLVFVPKKKAFPIPAYLAPRESHGYLPAS